MKLSNPAALKIDSMSQIIIKKRQNIYTEINKLNLL